MSERVIARKASGMVLKEAGEEVKYPMAYIADPEAPSVEDIVQTLESCVDTMYDHNIGRQQIHRAQAIIARLEGK